MLVYVDSDTQYFDPHYLIRLIRRTAGWRSVDCLSP